MGSAAVAAALFGLPLVSVAPAQADASSQWPLQYLKASQVWSITKGSGASVAVVDTGVASIADTQSSLLSGADFSASTTASSGIGQTDLFGHGTAMAVIIAGAGSITTGLAPGAKILPVRITAGSTMGPDAMAAGIRYAITQRVAVINLSQVVSYEDSNLATAIQDALSANIAVVAATGNNGASEVSYPAAYPGVIAVGATDQSGTIWSGSDTGAQVAIAAPGVNVPNEDNVGQAVTANGTSISAAYVSATVALVRAEHPSWTVGQVIRDLIGTADPGSGQAAGQHSDQFGYGIVDPLKALQAAAPGETSNPLLAGAGSSASASAGATGAGTAPATGGSGAAASSKSGSGVVVGIVAAVVVVVLIIVLIVALSRRNRNRPGGGGPGAGGGGGQYPQQNPYGQQGNPYLQQNPQGGGPYGQPQQQQYPQGGGYGQAPPQQYPYPPQSPQQGQPPQR